MNVKKEEVISLIEDAGVSINASSVNADMSLVDAGVDSLEMMNVYMGIEETYGIKIPDEDIDKLDSISSIVDYLNNI